MAGGFTISIKGMDKLIKSISTMPITLQANVDKELESAADDMVVEAVRKAPTDESGLRQSINARHSTFKHAVFMQKRYGVFQEFGTKSKFSAPSALGSYPSRFRGKGDGNYKDALAAMTGWVKRKGVTGTYSVKTRKRTGNKLTREKQDRQVAYLILRKILREGLKPRPYFFPAFFVARKRVMARIKKHLKDEIRKR
jgi:hypothetical protein